MQIKSVFKNNEPIPVKYTCDGDNINPPLEISEIPKNAETFVLICDDPDAPSKNWVHWVAFNIYAKNISRLEIKESANPGVNGVNDFGSLKYSGPCPPSGTHRYFFKVYALDSTLDLKEGASKKEVESAMTGTIIAQAVLIGTYMRK